MASMYSPAATSFQSLLANMTSVPRPPPLGGKPPIFIGLPEMHSPNQLLASPPTSPSSATSQTGPTISTAPPPAPLQPVPPPSSPSALTICQPSGTQPSPASQPPPPLLGGIPLTHQGATLPPPTAVSQSSVTQPTSASGSLLSPPTAATVVLTSTSLHHSPQSSSQTANLVRPATPPEDRRTSSIAALRLKAREHELKLEMLRQNGHNDVLS